MDKQEKKRKDKKDNNKDVKHIIKNKNIPVLTLDERWHILFPEDEKNAQIKELERKVNNLLKKQGKLGSDIKDMKNLKKSLMDEIMTNMSVSSNSEEKSISKKLEKNKQFIGELNDKLNTSMDELASIPYQIKEANQELMLESMKISYERINKNKEKIDRISEWITRMREDLKVKILEKQDMETDNTLIYTYMHDILGAELMEVFDNYKK